MKAKSPLGLVRAGARRFAIVLATLLAAHAAHASSATWSGATDGQWASTANWSGPPATVPGSGETATFNDAGTGNTLIDLAAGVTIQQVTFDTGSAAAYTLGSGGVGIQTLTFSGGGITLNSNLANNQGVDANVVLGTAAGDQTFTFTNNSGNSLSLAGGISSTTTGSKVLTVNGAGNTAISGAMTNGTGTLSLVKAGAGTLTLGGANSFTGGITVQRDGVLRSGASDVLPAANITIAAGTLDLNGFNDTIGSGSGNAIWFYTTGGAYNLTNTISTGAGTLTLNGNIGVDSDARTTVNLISGKLDLGSTTRTVSNASYGGIGHSAQMTPVHIAADISGVGVGITSTNSGAAAMLRLSGNNSYTGTTTPSSGYLQADHANALGVGGNITFTGNGTLQYTANSAGTDWSVRFKGSTKAISLDTNGQTVTLAGLIDNTNTLGLTKLGSGTLVLAGSVDNTYGGVTTVSGGTLELNTGGAVKAIAGGGLTINSGALAKYTGASTDMMGSGAVTINGSGQLDTNGATDTLGNVILAASGATGNTTPIINIASLTIGALNITPVAGFTSQINTGAGTLTLGNSVTFSAATTGQAQVSGTLALGSATRTFNVGLGTGAGHDLLIDAAITGGIGVGLTKGGTGRLALAGSNNYAGATLVNNGLLQYNALAAMAGSGRNITVTSPGAVALGYVPGTSIQDDLLGRIVSSSSGVLALTAATSESFDFSSGGPGNNFSALSLGAVGNVTYSGTLTPNGTTYRLGGGGGTLTMGNAISGAGKSLVISGSVILTTSSDFAATTINSGGQLQLNAGAMTNVTNNGAILFDFSGTQSYSGTISGSGGLTKAGSGSLTLTVPQTYTGTTTLTAGSLVLAGGNHTLNVNKALVVNGGTLDLGSNSQYVGQLTGSGGIITGSGGRFTVRSTGSATFAGSIQGTINLVKVGSQTLTLTSASSTAGTLSVLGGGLTLKDGGMFSATTGITLSGGSLTLDNTGTTNINGRVHSANVSLDGGTLTYTGANNTASTEALGAVTATAGVSNITVNAGTGTASAVLTLGSLTRSTGAALNVNATNLGTAANPYGRIVVSTALGGNLAAVNGVVPGVFSSAGVDSWNFVGYDAVMGFGALGTSGFPPIVAGLAGATAASNVTGGGTVAADQTINSYNQGNLIFTNGTAGGGLDRLTVGSGMMVMGADTWGSADARGRITSGTPELVIGKRDGNTNPPPSSAIHSVIEDNGGPVSLVVYARHADRGPYVMLTAANTHSGGTFVSGGSVQGGLLLNGSGVTLPAGGLTINNNGIVSMAGAAGQIDAGNVVTLNGGATLDLYGTNTLAGLVFNSAGGTSAPTVVPYLTVTVPAAYGLASYGAKTGTLRITGNITSTPANVAVTPLLDSGTLDLNGNSAHDITVAALPEGTFVNTLAPLNGLTISSVIANGGFTKKGAGVLNLTGASTFGGLLAVEEGVLNVASLNNAGANGVLGNSASAVSLGGSGGKTGTLEYTGGNLTCSKPFTLATGGTGAFQIDAATTTLTLSGLIGGGGGLTKTGAGTLALSNTGNSYTGNTTIVAGKLTVSGLCLADSATVTIGSTAGSGAILNLPNAGTDMVAALVIGGVSQPDGLYDATNTGGAITGSGKIQVGTGGASFEMWAQTHITAINPAADASAGGDPDADGSNNLAEFAFNGDPLSAASRGKVYVLTADSEDAGTATELILTIAVRTDTPGFSADNSPKAISTVDGITYTIEGSITLDGFPAKVNVLTTAVVPVADPAPGTGYVYRSFSLDGSNGLTDKGFLRAKVTRP